MKTFSTSSIDIDIINRKNMNWKLEKEINSAVKKQLDLKKTEFFHHDQKVREKLQESASKSEIKLKSKLENLERLIQEEINAQQEQLKGCDDYAERVKRNFERKSLNFNELCNEMQIREENKRKQVGIFEKYKIIYLASMENFTKIFERLSPASRQRCHPLKKVVLELLAKFDEIVSLQQYSSKELDAIDKICKDLDHVNKELLKEEQASEEIKKLQEQQDLEFQRQQQLQQSSPAEAQIDTTDKGREEIDQSSSINDESLFGTSENFTKYETFYVFYKTQSNEEKDFQADRNMENVRFGFKKAINVPLNAINAVSVTHFKDKYDRLLALLNGNTVQVDRAQVSTRDNPIALLYCKKYLAEKFVVGGGDFIKKRIPQLINFPPISDSRRVGCVQPCQFGIPDSIHHSSFVATISRLWQLPIGTILYRVSFFGSYQLATPQGPVQRRSFEKSRLS